MNDFLRLEVDPITCTNQDRDSWLEYVTSRYGAVFASRCEISTRDLPDLLSDWPEGKVDQIIEQTKHELWITA